MGSEKIGPKEFYIQQPGKEIGTYIEGSATPLFDERSGEVTASLGLIRDITAQKAAQTQLTEALAEVTQQAELLDATFNGISEGIIVAGKDGEFKFWNSAAEEFVGIGPVELPPKEWPEFYGTYYPDGETPMPTEELPLVKAAIHGQDVDDVELIIRNPNRPDGVNLRARVRPLRDEEGELTGGVVFFRDISQLVLAEKALLDAFAHGRLEILETVLHNIGNAINSITVGVDSLHQTLTANVVKHRFEDFMVAIRQHEDDWVDYIRNDPQGQQVFAFLVAFARDGQNEYEQFIRILERVKGRAKHVEDIILEQKSLGSAAGLRKDVVLSKVVSNAVNVLQESLVKRDIVINIDCKNAPKEIRI